MNEEDEIFDHWEDEDFRNEMKRRIDDFESGREPGIPWEEVKEKTDALLKQGNIKSLNNTYVDQISPEELKKIIDECDELFNKRDADS